MKSLFLFILSAFLYCTGFAQTVISNATPGNVYAMVVGISSYSDPDIPQLQFANRDAEIFADYLKSKAGGSVPKENIRLLTDSNATNAAVYNAIYWLRKTCKKDDIVFFYFSGHGDVENITMFNNAFLICYNSPGINYVGMALSVQYLNAIANTLSVKNGAKIILITDACHSGKVAANITNANVLVGQQLMAASENEIRIASCMPDQLSNESVAWGDGRGVFSYYLIKGLKGVADINKDSTVTLTEIRSYLETSMKNDNILKAGKEQTPVIKGNNEFPLSKIDKDEFNKTRMQAVDDSLANATLLSTVMMNTDDENMEPDAYFFKLLKNYSLEELTDSLRLDTASAAEIPLALIKKIKETEQHQPDINKLIELENNLHNSKESLNQFTPPSVCRFRADHVWIPVAVADADYLDHVPYPGLHVCVPRPQGRSRYHQGIWGGIPTLCGESPGVFPEIREQAAERVLKSKKTHH